MSEMATRPQLFWQQINFLKNAIEQNYKPILWIATLFTLLTLMVDNITPQSIYLSFVALQNGARHEEPDVI